MLDLKEEIEGNGIYSKISKPHHQSVTAGNYRTVKKITKLGSCISWKRLKSGSIFHQTVKNLTKLLKTHFTNGVFYSYPWAVCEISQPIWRKACPNRGLFLEVGCGLFGWELNEPEFQWLDLILPLLVSSIKSAQRSKLKGGRGAQLRDFSFKTKTLLPRRAFGTGRFQQETENTSL